MKTKTSEMLKAATAVALIAAAMVAVALACGCMRVIEIDKRDPVPLPNATNATEYAEGGYSVTYKSIGLKTDVSSIEASKTESGVTVKIEGVQTDVSERNAAIIESSGTATGKVIGEAAKAAAAL